MKLLKNLSKLALGALTGYALTQLAWIFKQLAKADPRATLSTPQNKAPKRITALTSKTGPNYTVQHVIEDGIERIIYTPKERRFETPILMQHGMWHGA